MGRAYCQRLRAEGIDASGVATTSRALTGTALIAVDRAAENSIIVAAAANGELQPSMIRAQEKRIASGDILLLQFEVPMATVIQAVRIANQARVPVVLNPSPLRDGFPWGRCELDTVIANADEAQEIFGLELDNLPVGLALWRDGLAQRRIQRLIVTQGARPTLCLSRAEYLKVPTLAVQAGGYCRRGRCLCGGFCCAPSRRRRHPGRDSLRQLRRGASNAEGRGTRSHSQPGGNRKGTEASDPVTAGGAGSAGW